MLRLPRLKYLRPRSVSEAAEMAAANPGSMFMAGGTDLVPNLKRRQFDASVLISLSGLPDSRSVTGDAVHGLTIGPNVTLAELSSHRALEGAYRALAQACGLVSTPQVRYMGTIAGNLLVDPRCNYYNQTYAWRKAVGFCLKEDGIDYLTKSPHEIVTTLHLPPARSRMTSAYLKLRRRPAFDFPILGVAVAIAWEDGSVREARGCLGGVGSQPVDITSHLAPLSGKRPSDDVIA